LVLVSFLETGMEGKVVDEEESIAISLMYAEQNLALYHVKIVIGKCSTIMLMVAAVCVLYMRL
jgi:hypothetical protein